MSRLLLQRHPTPAGELLLGAADGAIVLCDWSAGRRRAETDRRLAAAFPSRAEGGSPLLSRLGAELDEYFAAGRRAFDLPIALRIGTPFERSVWEALRAIPYGATETYGALARRLGRPGAQRAVAAAIGRNPLSLLLPCHRVVAADGPGGYGGGLPAKRLLLRLEREGGAPPDVPGRADPNAPPDVRLSPIGHFRGAASRKYEAPRQGVFSGGAGFVELLPRHGYEQALRDLDGFERVWLIFLFHRNGGAWRPTTRPPVSVPGHGRVGTFASRSPYRPNPIGLTCARLVRVGGRRLHVEDADLLDGTPILDIKPYLPAADAFPAARAGWVDERQETPWRVVFSPLFTEQARAIRAWQGPDLAATASVQLANDPFDATRKRVARRGSDSGTLSLRMFRLDFRADPATRTVTLERVRSGYSPHDLAVSDDPYADKALHRRFAAVLWKPPSDQ